MKTTYQRTFLLFLTIFVVIFSLFNTQVTFADDGTPPVGPLATEVPVGTDIPPITEEVSSETLEQTESEPVIVAEILEQLPEDTQLIVVDENGSFLPLATLDAAEFVIENDPMWCPAGQIPGDAGCTASYTTVTALIANLGSKSGAGTIYFTPTYSVNDAVFDHINANLSALTDLTIQGGWNGLTGNAFALSGASTFNGVGLTITNWNNAITIKNIKVIGANVSGIYVTTTGDIQVENVTSNGNKTDYGAYLDNCLSGNNITCAGTGSVTLTGTNIFNGNNRIGLVVLSGGNISVNNVTANDNKIEGGAYLVNKGWGTGSITLTGTNIFNDNNWCGLLAESSGDIRANNITANYNNSSGACLVAMGGFGTGSITLTGTNIFNDNNSNGLEAWADADINLNNVTANGNKNYNGAYLVGWGSITLTGKNVFNGNNWSGLEAHSNGDINLNNVTANDNKVYSGVLLEGSSATFTQSLFCNNNQYGIDVLAWSLASITLNNVSGGENGLGNLNNGGAAIFNSADCTPEGGDKKVLVNPRLSLQIAGSSANFDCSLFAGTTLILPNGNKVTFKCPISGSATLNSLANDGLPDNLSKDVNFVSGLVAVQSPTGSDKALDGQVIVSFIIPESVQNANLAILYWDGGQWVDLKSASFQDGRAVINGGYVTGDGYFEAVTNFSGNFVLVTK